MILVFSFPRRNQTFQRWQRHSLEKCPAQRLCLTDDCTDLQKENAEHVPEDVPLCCLLIFSSFTYRSCMNLLCLLIVICCTYTTYTVNEDIVTSICDYPDIQKLYKLIQYFI